MLRYCVEEYIVFIYFIENYAIDCVWVEYMCCEPSNIFEHLKRCKKLQFHPLKAGKHADADML